MAQPIWNTASGSIGTFPSGVAMVYQLSASAVLPAVSGIPPPPPPVEVIVLNTELLPLLPAANFVEGLAPPAPIVTVKATPEATAKPEAVL
jgi:hypothetical protein